jgi:hypothetical protein
MSTNVTADLPATDIQNNIEFVHCLPQIIARIKWLVNNAVLSNCINRLKKSGSNTCPIAALQHFSIKSNNVVRTIVTINTHDIPK